MVPEDTIETTRQFITNLELPPLPPEPQTDLPAGPLPQSGIPEGYVAGGNLVSFMAGVPALNRSDVLNSTLLAQLAADKQHDRHYDTDKWYALYVKVLGSLGWVTEGLEFERYSPGGDSLIVNEALVEIVAAIVAPDVLKVVIALLEGMRGLRVNDRRWVLWSSYIESQGIGTFQVVASWLENGSLVLQTVSFYLRSRVKESRLLWHTFSTSDAEFNKAVERATLNEQIYEQIRQQVETKLGDRAKRFVANIEI